MNEEEQKAIEDLRGYLEWNDKNSFSRLPRDNHMETVLNLISKLQKENKELSEKMVDKICKGIEEEVLEEYREKIKKLQKELDSQKQGNKDLVKEGVKLSAKIVELQKKLDKQDKVIDLMAEYLNENNREFWTDDIEETKQYFYKKVEEENDI